MYKEGDCVDAALYWTFCLIVKSTVHSDSWLHGGLGRGWKCDCKVLYYLYQATSSTMSGKVYCYLLVSHYASALDVPLCLLVLCLKLGSALSGSFFLV